MYTFSCIKPLLEAVSGGHLNIVKNLVEEGTNVDYDCVSKSAEVSPVDILIYLLPKYICVFDRYSLGPLLVVACRKGCLENVKYLVSVGADTNVSGYQPLRIAVIYGYLDIVKYLLHLKSEDTQIPLGWENYGTPFLDDLVDMADDLEVVMYLVSMGADRKKISIDAEKFIHICERSRIRAQKKIYYWWIPICYDTTRECGKRMMQKNWAQTHQLLIDFFEDF